ncbi:MAG: peptide chain release factor 2 [Actinobacteria bacterium]|nr:peptide chain release factor 2 [Actinomycetota bacterium]
MNSMYDLKREILRLENSLADISEMMSLDKLNSDINSLEEESQSEDLWKDGKSGSRLMKKLAAKKNVLRNFTDLRDAVNSYIEIFEESSRDDLELLESDLQHEVGNTKLKIENLEAELQFSGEYDDLDALITISGGAGGADAQDWASMILRMYLRWTDKKKFKSELLSMSPGDEAGIKSALLKISGENAYGLLKGEKGVHRLVRLSPFNSANLRHTSFALVEIIPDFQDSVNVEINNDDLKIEAFKASGAGGQSVQKNSSAIRITHNPSGLVVSVQNERSQSQNKNIALQILKSRLMEIEVQKNKDKKDELKGEFVSAEWGNQVRSYVLHPYTLVKDNRTGFEVTDVSDVLDGNIDSILLDYLRFSKRSKSTQ